MTDKKSRKPHWLGRTSGGEMPRRIWYIGISGERIDGPEGNGLWAEHGRCVHVICVDYYTPRPVVIDQFCAGSRGDFWRILAQSLRRRKVNWIYFRDLSRALTLTGAWELIESNIIRYQSACLTDPPIWIRCAVAGRSMLLCDTRNYGDDEMCEISGALIEQSYCQHHRKTAAQYWEMCALSEAQSIRAYVEPIYMSIVGMGGAAWKPTISGLAWSLYRRHFIPMTSEPYDDENKAYNGQ